MEPPSSLAQAKDLQDDIVVMRRLLHNQPELAFEEFQTAKLLADTLESYGYSIKSGIATTGLIAQTGSGPAVAIHAAMDAISLSGEEPSCGISHASHACGHDANMACVLGAARILARRLRGRGEGTAKIIFQPGTEAAGFAGREAADKLIRSCATDGCKAILGLHVDSTIRAGNISIVQPVHTTEQNRQVSEIMRSAAEHLVGTEKVTTVNRATYGNDFSLYLEMAPGALMYLGVGRAGRWSSHHSPDFVIDESVLYIGAAILTETVFRLLEASPKVI